MANTPTSPLDTTGRAAEQAQKRRSKELADRADEIALSRQAEAESLANDVFDPKAAEKPILIDEVEEVGVALKDESVIIRTITDIDNMTYGVINGRTQNYTFKAGVRYKVSRDLAAYLERLGYLWLA